MWQKDGKVFVNEAETYAPTVKECLGQSRICCLCSLSWKHLLFVPEAPAGCTDSFTHDSDVKWAAALRLVLVSVNQYRI